jgi:DNA recombination protein RmuC
MDPYLYFIFAGVAIVLLLILLLRRNTPPPATDREHFVPKELYHTLVAQHEMLRAELAAKEQNLREAMAQLAARDQQVLHLEQTLRTQKGETEQLQARFKTEFENIANRLLEEKSQRFTDQNAQQLQSILLPLREKIRDFEANIDRKFSEETREKSALRHEIGQLRDLNQQLSQDAGNLVSALKGQSKVQGDWGELQLEVILEKAGLVRGVHFLAQTTLRNEDGLAKRPDFIIQLPENRQLIVDSKVSLTAFERFFNENDPAKRDQHLRAHVASIRSHVDNLSKTNYQFLQEVNTPDYLLLFIPLENALTVASQADPQLFNDALERNVVLVTSGSLMATMRTVAPSTRGLTAMYGVAPGASARIRVRAKPALAII